MLSFNLSGPITLGVCVLFFSSVRFSPAQMRWVTVSLLAPIFAIAAFAAFNLQTALKDADVDFGGGASNATASGGFGANQVSAVLGLGIVAVVVYLILGNLSWISVGVQMALLLFLTRQTLVTLSRGGAYMALGAVGAGAIYLIRDRRVRKWLLIGAGGVGAILILILIPRLDALTGGVFRSRFENTGGTGRELLIKGDFDSFSQSPILGVGPGLGGVNRLKYFYVATAHTEYTRMVAEHGLLGLIALAALAAMAIRSIQSQSTWRAKAIAAAWLAYAVLFMLVDATRLAAPAFAFGLSSVPLVGGRRRAQSRLRTDSGSAARAGNPR